MSVTLMRNRDELIDVDGARLRVRIAGSGPAVLFVHGWALDLDMWNLQFEALSSRYRLIALDRRGFGLSSGAPGIEHDVADLDQLLGALRVERVALVGMSQGARVALRWALKSRSRATCLVLDGPPREGPSTSGRSQPEIPFCAYRELVRREGMDAFRKQWLEHPFMRLRTNDASTRALLGEIVGRYPGRDLMAGCRTKSPPIEGLHLLDVPTLVVNGEHDSAARRAAGAELARVLPNAQLAVIPQAGHLANLDNPTTYNELLSKVLEAHQAPVEGALESPFHRSAAHAE